MSCRIRVTSRSTCERAATVAADVASLHRILAISLVFCCSNTLRVLTVSLTRAKFFTFLARAAKRRVESVSAKCLVAGATLQITVVLAFPPRLGARMRVSLESRNGMCVAGVPSASLLMTVPSVRSDLLMDAPSLSLSPLVCALRTRSLPARSTSVSTPNRVPPRAFPLLALDARICDSTTMRKMLWLLLDCLFIAVSLVALNLLPLSMRASAASASLTMCSRRPATYMPLSASSLMLSLCFAVGSSRSRSSSL